MTDLTPSSHPHPPDSHRPHQKRRQEDTKRYTTEWTILLASLLGWAASFMLAISEYETWEVVWTPKFLGLHVAQLFTVMSSVLAAKRIR